MLVADPSRAREVLGWQARISDMDSILATAWAWHNRRAPAAHARGTAGARIP